eukprot:GHVQ01003920.1.p1 GENE.GHVQ01003920.1~~GHVQ01003920.1.p1  ORF type:complete len:101 (+),score=9.76 GHVQ01003920.1:54-356(+)
MCVCRLICICKRCEGEGDEGVAVVYHVSCVCLYSVFCFLFLTVTSTCLFRLGHILVLFFFYFTVRHWLCVYTHVFCWEGHHLSPVSHCMHTRDTGEGPSV